MNSSSCLSNNSHLTNNRCDRRIENLYISASISVEGPISGAPLSPPASFAQCSPCMTCGRVIVVFDTISPSTRVPRAMATVAMSCLSSGDRSGAIFTNNGGWGMSGALIFGSCGGVAACIAARTRLMSTASSCLLCRPRKPGHNSSPFTATHTTLFRFALQRELIEPEPK
jgi:hypothetical protein